MARLKGTHKVGATTDTFSDAIDAHPLLAKGAAAQELTSTANIEKGALTDTGGIPIILRRFQYQLPPKTQINKEEILKHHKPRILPFLWKDGLEEIAEPKVVIGKKGKFDIFITCQPRKGELLHERPHTLGQALNSQ